MRIKIALLAVIAASCCGLTLHAKKSDNKKELPPVFVTCLQNNYVMANYWTNLDDPNGLDEADKESLESLIKDWNRQETFRKNASAYTNLISQNGKGSKVKFRKELITDPDGNALWPGILHYHPDIPTCCAIYDVVGPSEIEEFRHGVIVTDEYLNKHRLLPLSEIQSGWESETPLPAETVQALEQHYGMEANLSKQLCRIGDGYIYGFVQFKGEWKDAPKRQYQPDSKSCLAVDVLADGKELYVKEQIGYYESEADFGWNVDDEGLYSGYPVIAAFQGVEGPVLCCIHEAPESLWVGVYNAVDGRLDKEFVAGYQSMIDEEIPVWKSDIATMERLYYANDSENGRNTKFTQWGHVYVRNGGEIIWANNGGENLTGAIFQRRDGKLRLIAETARNRKPASGMKGDKGYLSVSGYAGGPSWYREIYVFQDGQLVETFNCLEVYGNIDGCTLNGVEISSEEGNAYIDNLPEFEALPHYFNTME